jgi:hypothetical protein
MVVRVDVDPEILRAYFSQQSILYRDRECGGGWPMESPNPHARDPATAKELVETSYDLVGLEKWVPLGSVSQRALVAYSVARLAPSVSATAIRIRYGQT